MLFLTPTDLSRCDEREVASIAARRDFVVAFGAGELGGLPLAAALHADWLALDDQSTVLLPGGESAFSAQAVAGVWSGVVGRIGPAALRLFVVSAGRLTAADAVRAGIADSVVGGGSDPLEWFGRWLGGRSSVALDSAAALVRGRGGDVLERAEFSRLFATGEPHEGLRAFLGKRRPRFSEPKVHDKS